MSGLQEGWVSREIYEWMNDVDSWAVEGLIDVWMDGWMDRKMD